MILVAALIIGMVPMTAFAFKANPTPTKLQIPVGATSAAASNVTIEETTTGEFPVADTQVDVTLLDSANATTTVHFANVPTVVGTNAHSVSLVSDTHLRFTINGSAGTDSFTLSNINYKVDSGAATGDVKFVVAVTGGDTNTFNNATIVNGVYTGIVGTKNALSASGTGILVAGISATESAAGQFQGGKTITLSLANAGVTFTQIPTTTVTGANLDISSGSLSSDFKTATWTINTASTGAGNISFGGIKLDIASSTAAGDINVNIATSGTTPINPASLAVANLTVSGTIAASATSNAITTGNGKAAGDITLTESQAKSFTTTNNPLTVALGNGATFQVAPTATGSGGITFASGSSSVTSTAGSLAGDFKSANWTINSQSTSTAGITISGIMINVPAGTTGDITATVTGGGISGTKTVTIASLAAGSIATAKAGPKTVLKVNAPSQAGADVTITEASAGSIANGSALYLQIFGQSSLTEKTINFSQLPTVKVTSGDLTLGTPVLQDNGLTVKIPVTTKSSSMSTIKVSNIQYDVSSKAVNGDVTLDVRYSATGDVFANASRLTTVVDATIGAVAQAFKDVPATHFAFNAIQFLSSAGIVSGRPNGDFDPNASITRGEFAKIICLAAGLTPVSGGTASFSDTSGNWAAGYIEAAKTAGLIGGYPDGTFRPNALITRAEIAKMVVGAAGFATNTSGAGFSDIATSWAKDYILTAANNGIVNGYSDGTFRPDNHATRAEASVMVYNWLAN